MCPRIGIAVLQGCRTGGISSGQLLGRCRNRPWRVVPKMLGLLGRHR
jgi:hypothetical protein